MSLLPFGLFVFPCARFDTVCLGPGDESLLDPQTKIHKRPRFVCDRVDEVGATALGVVCRLHYVCRRCGCNLHNALCMRHGRAQPSVFRGFVHARLFFDSLVPEVMRAYNDWELHYFFEWMAKWPLAKRALILRSVDFDAVVPDSVLIFIKREGGQNVPTKARGIQMYVNLATQSSQAWRFSALQKAYCDVLYRRGGRIRVTFASGMNSLALGRWLTDCLADIADPWFYERDGKNWDSTIQLLHHLFKMGCYAGMPPDFVAFVNSGFVVRGKGYCSQGVLSYTLNGTTKSGHNDTTLGNSLINAAIAFEAMSVLGLSGDILVAGDDLLVIVEGSFDEHAFASVERSLGIIPEYRKFHDWLDVSFCSGVWWSIPGGHAFTPKPGRLLARLWWSVHPPSQRQVADYRRSVVAGLLPTCGGLPVVGDFLRSHDLCGRVRPWQGKRFDVTSCEVDFDPSVVRVEFSRRYGLSLFDIDEASETLRLLSGRVCLLRHPALERIMDVDLADCVDRPLAS